MTIEIKNPEWVSEIIKLNEKEEENPPQCMDNTHDADSTQTI